MTIGQNSAINSAIAASRDNLSDRDSLNNPSVAGVVRNNTARNTNAASENNAAANDEEHDVAAGNGDYKPISTRSRWDTDELWNQEPAMQEAYANANAYDSEV